MVTGTDLQNGRSAIYLCGPIQACNDQEAHGWRDMIQEKYPTYTYRDPMVRDYRGRELECMADIVEIDKIDIAESDVVLVNWPGDKPSAGTSMEIIYAWMTDKLVVVVSPKNLKLSPWIVYHSHAQFHDWDEAMDWIWMNKNKRHWREREKEYVAFEITPIDGANDPFDRINRQIARTGQKANTNHEAATSTYNS